MRRFNVFFRRFFILVSCFVFGPGCGLEKNSSPGECDNLVMALRECGYNARGTQERECGNGQWGPWGECVAPKVLGSCYEILHFYPNSEDGEYTIAPLGTNPMSVFCDMTSDGGGWTRIAEHDFAEEPCLGQWESNGAGACYRPEDEPASAFLEPLGIRWSEARFKMGIGSANSNDAFGWRDRSEWTLEDSYVDGVSMTTGEVGYRKHLFTYAFGSPGAQTGSVVCPELGGAQPQLFVAQSYACDAAEHVEATEPLFTHRWFLGKASGRGGVFSPIEVRLMGDEPAGNENTYVYYLSVLVR